MGLGWRQREAGDVGAGEVQAGTRSGRRGDLNPTAVPALARPAPHTATVGWRVEG